MLLTDRGWKVARSSSGHPLVSRDVHAIALREVEVARSSYVDDILVTLTGGDVM